MYQVHTPGRLFLAMAFLFMALPALGQIPGEAWERIALLGHDVKCLEFSPDFDSDQTLFAGTGGLGVWRSRNGGDTWQASLTAARLAGSVVVDLAVSPDFANDQTVFAITDDGFIFKCANGAGTTFTFTQVLAAPRLSSRGSALAISPNYASDQTVFAAYYGDGFWYSTDGGATWTQDTASMGRLPYILDIAVDPGYPSPPEVLVGGRGQDGCLMRRYGGSWSKITFGGGDGDTDTITRIFNAGNDNYWVGTLNNGSFLHRPGGWSSLWDGTSANDRPPVGSLYWTPGGSTPSLLEGRGDGLYVSTDSGGNGTTCSLLDPAHPIQVAKYEPGWDGASRCRLYIGTPSGLVRRSCAARSGRNAATTVDGWAVVRAPNGTAHFMGSQGQGLFKNVSGTSMVRYNNFPNGLVPEIAAVCLDPQYDETGYAAGDCLADKSVLFVAANFPLAAGDNGVYKSDDFGNSWTKLATNWPTTPITVYDLAISPSYSEAGPDTTLYAATSQGIYRWDGSTAGWSYRWRTTPSPVYRVAVPPLYNRWGGSGWAYHGVFASTDDGVDNQVWFSRDDGVAWEILGYRGDLWGRVTGFAFAADFGLGARTELFVSAIPADIGGVGGVFTATYPWGIGYWSSRSTGLGSSPVVWDIAGEPQFMRDEPFKHMLCATPTGVYRTAEAGLTWTRVLAKQAFSVSYDRADASGQAVVAGLQRTGAVFSGDGGTSWSSFTGYHYLPDDVWATVAHERNPDILFSSSPSMGVFVSEDKGISYRPWNKGKRGTAGPCVLRTGLGLAMLADRRGTNLDVVWAGTVSEGIKARYAYYDPTTGRVDLETENGSTANGWRHNFWYPSGDQVSGRWERIETVPDTGQGYPVWASSQTGASAAQGMAALPAGPWWSLWRRQNTGLPSLETRGMRQGYAAPEPVPIGSGQTAGGEVAQGQWDYYALTVPSGTDDFRVFLDDLDDYGPADPDLYVRYGALPDQTQWDFRPYINGDEAVCHGSTAATLLDESFTSGIPGTWTVVDGGSGGGAAPTWTAANPCTRSIGAPFSGSFAMVDSDCAGNTATQDEELRTPALDCRLYGTVTLTFSNQFRYFNYNNNEICDVDVLLADGSWQNVLRMQGASDGYPTPNTKTVDLSPYAAGRSNVQIRFHYYNATYEYWWAIDNVRVTASRPAPGTWYLGVRGYSAGTSPYELTATLDSGCTSAPEAAAPPRDGKKADPCADGPLAIDPKAPHGGTIWGTVNGAGGGVYLGTGSPSGTVTWEARNGVAPTNLTNLMANTVVQLPDLTLVVGCQGDVFTSPAPDEGRTTWVSRTDGVASAGSNDFRDLLVAANGDLLIAADGTGTGTSAGGVWLSGDLGGHWMRLSQGFDAASQHIEDLVMDKGTPVQYYASTDGTGVFSRTITAQPYPTVTNVTPPSGSPDGGTEVTITGTGFSTECPTGTLADCPDSVPVVLFGETEVPATFVNDTELRATAPAYGGTGAVTVRVRNPDTRRSSSGRAFTYACAAPSGMANNGAADADPYADTGVLVTWSDPSPWGDGGSGTRSFSVLRDGAVIRAGLPASTHAFTDTTGTNGVTYTYAVRALNGCGQATTTAGVAAADEFRVPEEVPTTSFQWSGGTKTTLSWSAATGADSYRVYRGEGADVGDLPSGASVCLAYEGTETTTGELLLSEPAAGQFYWYLVVGVNGAGEGSAGSSRSLVSTGGCPSP